MSYVLDTSEIVERHTSENLMEHIHKVLRDYDINTESKTQHNIIFNFNATNPNNIHEEDQECDDEVNYLNTDNEVTEITVNEDYLSESQTQELFDIMPNNTNENVSHNSSFSRQHSTQSTDSESIYQSTSHNVTFITDNASDIGKAITKIGGYPWFGCAGHHLNLIAHAGFKQVAPAATLLKNASKLWNT